MKDKGFLALALIAGALWLLFRRNATAAATGEASPGSPIIVNATGPTINENLEVAAVLETLTGKNNVPYKVNLKTPDYMLFYQNVMPFDPYADSPVLNPLNVTRP